MKNKSETLILIAAVTFLMGIIVILTLNDTLWRSHTTPTPIYVVIYYGPDNLAENVLVTKSKENAQLNKVKWDNQGSDIYHAEIMTTTMEGK